MKFNKWTLSLAALGVVSLASAAKAADESKFVETAVSGTQISGYVNTSAHWNFNAYQNTYDTSKKDGFNLDAVEVTIAKPLDETDWAAGYTVQMVYGQDASTVGVPFGSATNSSAGFGSVASIKQAFVELRAPVGNGLDIKVGLWDTILGYEGFDSGNNPNYTRSYGYLIEPTSYTGILASYKFCDVISAQAGVANTANTPLGRSNTDSRKTYLGSVALTAPNSWGFLAGSTLYGAVAYGAQSGSGSDLNQINWYAGTVINTGVKGLKFGASYDYVGFDNGSSSGLGAGWVNAFAVYSSFQATDKLSFHVRGEYAWAGAGTPITTPSGVNLNIPAGGESSYSATATVQYDLWKNVLSRAEIRWDHAKDAVFTSTQNKDSVLLAANLIYKF